MHRNSVSRPILYSQIALLLIKALDVAIKLFDNVLLAAMRKYVLGWIVVSILLLNVGLIVVEILEIINNMALLGLIEA